MDLNVEKKIRPGRGWPRVVVVNVLVACLLVVFLEGLSSIYLSIEQIGQRDRFENAIAERVHTIHDPLLGWINAPNVSIRDMYGPEITLTTNAQGFRNDRDFPTQVPQGRVRIICSGDSFTLGYGVDDAHTWCQQLAGLDPRFETVNMGQGGYGVDQMYLWYMREGVRLDHQIHLFAVIFDGFRRMRGDTFVGYPKPVMRIRDGQRVVENVPVPELTLHKVARRLQTFKLVELFKRAWDRLAGLDDGDSQARDAEIKKIVGLLLGELRRLSDEKKIIPAIVYLPTWRDYRGGPSREWRPFLRRAAEDNGVYFIDLVPKLRKLSEADASRAFILAPIKNYPGSAGHYSNAGNALVAEWLHEAILAMPGVRRLESGPGGG